MSMVGHFWMVDLELRVSKRVRIILGHHHHIIIIFDGPSKEMEEYTCLSSQSTCRVSNRWPKLKLNFKEQSSWEANSRLAVQ
jgi:hypothetical protein